MTRHFTNDFVKAIGWKLVKSKRTIFGIVQRCVREVGDGNGDRSASDRLLDLAIWEQAKNRHAQDSASLVG